MAEFRVVLDGLELQDHEHAAVAQAVLEAGVRAVGSLERFASGENAPAFAAFSADKLVLDGGVRGGWVLHDELALRARAALQEQGILPRDLGSPGRG